MLHLKSLDSFNVLVKNEEMFVFKDCIRPQHRRKPNMQRLKYKPYSDCDTVTQTCFQLGCLFLTMCVSPPFFSKGGCSKSIPLHWRPAKPGRPTSIRETFHILSLSIYPKFNKASLFCLPSSKPVAPKLYSGAPWGTTVNSQCTPWGIFPEVTALFWL